MQDLELVTYIISFVTLYFGLGYGLLILNHKRAGKEGFLNIPFIKEGISEPNSGWDIFYFNLSNWNKKAKTLIHKKNTKTLPLALLGLFAILILIGTVIYFVAMPMITIFTYKKNLSLWPLFLPLLPLFTFGGIIIYFIFYIINMISTPPVFYATAITIMAPLLANEYPEWIYFALTLSIGGLLCMPIIFSKKALGLIKKDD